MLIELGAQRDRGQALRLTSLEQRGAVRARRDADLETAQRDYQLRLRLGQPPADETSPWDASLVVLAGFRFEPARRLAMSDSELARTVLEAFRDSLKRLSF